MSLILFLFLEIQFHLLEFELNEDVLVNEKGCIMATHMSIRLAWHSDGWNGHICRKPCENSYCVGEHSYPGDLIASARNLEFEASHAGEPCSKYPCSVACGLSANAFENETIKVKVDVPVFWPKGSAEPATITLPPYTACTWCYEQMYNEAAEYKGSLNYKNDCAQRKRAAEDYFSQFESGKSLIFYYAGYSNPFSENEENNYVVVGISRVKQIESTCYYNNVSEEVQERYAAVLSGKDL